MKIPLLSRCLLTIPSTAGEPYNDDDDDDASYTSKNSVRSTISSRAADGSTNKSNPTKRGKSNLISRMRKNTSSFRLTTKQDYTVVARQALGLDDAQFQKIVPLSSPSSLTESSSTKSSDGTSDASFPCYGKETIKIIGLCDIPCKDLHKKTSVSSKTLPSPQRVQDTGNHTKGRDVSLDKNKEKMECSTLSSPSSTPTKKATPSSLRMSTTTRQNSLRSFIDDDSISGHSIIDELLMEEYVDPYKEFLKETEAEKTVKEEEEEEDGILETDVLTQLPSIKTTYSPKKNNKKKLSRRNTMHASSTYPCHRPSYTNSRNKTTSLSSRRGSLTNITNTLRVDSDSVHDISTKSIPSPSSINHSKYRSSNNSNVVVRSNDTNQNDTIDQQQSHCAMKEKAVSSMIPVSASPTSSTISSTVSKKDDHFPKFHHRKVPMQPQQKIQNQQRRSTMATSSPTTTGSYHGRLEV